MRVVILGGGGMVGHKLWQVFAPRFDTHVAARKPCAACKRYNIFDPARWNTGIDVWQFSTGVQILEELRPAVVINAIGIVKQLPEADDPIVSLTINPLFPHRLATLCRAITGWVPPSWDEVVTGLVNDKTEYDRREQT